MNDRTRYRTEGETQPLDVRSVQLRSDPLTAFQYSLALPRLTWRPGYDPFFYEQLAKRARRLYLFREEYIVFDVGGVVVETPQLGHATYLFARPASMEAFRALYIQTSKEEIRANRNNVAERLGFLGRIVHGVNPRAWLKDLRAKLGEPMDMSLKLK